MPTYQISFTGRTKGALGTHSGFTATRTALTEAQAIIDLYDEYEHIFPSRVLVLPMTEHKNERYNIIQAESNRPDFVVIEGKRAPGGYPETGAKVLTGAMSRDEAIRTADIMQRTYDRSHRHG